MFGKQKTEAEQRDRIIAYKRTFGSEEGKLVFRDICKRTFVRSPHKGDPYSEGQRSVALYIWDMIDLPLEQFDELMKGE